MKKFDAQHVEQSFHVHGKFALWYLEFLQPKTYVMLCIYGAKFMLCIYVMLCIYGAYYMLMGNALWGFQMHVFANC